jgi:hypothetical protein
VGINIHMNDAYANAETNARGYWYGFAFYGTACFDGANPMTSTHYTEDQQQYNYYNNLIKSRLSVESPLEMQGLYTTGDQVVYAYARVKNTSASALSNVAMQFMVYEDLDTEEYHHLCREIPAYETFSIDPGQTLYFYREIPMDPGDDLDRIGVIAFVQDRNAPNKDLQQACEAPRGETTTWPEEIIDRYWNWFSIPLVPLDANPESVLGIDCGGDLFRWDKYIKAVQVYQPPFVSFDLSVGDSYLLRLDAVPDEVSYPGAYPGSGFEFLLGRQGWTWLGKPGTGELGYPDFMDQVTVEYPVGSGDVRTAAEDRLSGAPWVNWGWAHWDAHLQAPRTFIPYSPFGDNVCYPWVGYRAYVNIGTAETQEDPDQVVLTWP